METLKYTGIGQVQSACGYASHRTTDGVVMVFEHMHQGTSPTNVIEDLCSLMFNRDFNDEDLENLQVFEVDRSETGLFEFQQVRFRKVLKVSADEIQQLDIELEGADSICNAWRFIKPGWSRLDISMQELLGGAQVG